MNMPSRPGAAVTLSALVAVALTGCTGGAETTTSSAVAPVPTERTATEQAATDRLLGLFPVVQIWPDTNGWPPLQVLGPQVWPAPATTDAPVTTNDVAEETAPPIASVAPVSDPGAIAAVQAQVGVTESAYETAVRNPDDPSLRAGIEAATIDESPAQLEFVSAYDAIVAAGQRSVPDPDVANSIELVTLPFIEADGQSATVVICHVTGDSLVDDSGQVVSDVRNAWLVIEEFRTLDEDWKLYARHALGVTPEGTQCETDLLNESRPQSSLAPP